LETLTRIFRDVFRNETIELHAGSTPDTIAGWDSFKYVSVIVALEKTYGIALDGPELDTLQTVGDLAALIQARATGAAA
jgi:acyl carrier protein